MLENSEEVYMKLIQRENPGKGLEVRDFHDAFQDLVRSFWNDDAFPTDLAGAEWNFHADVFEKDNKVFAGAARQVRRLQSGSMYLYLMYVAVALVLLLVIARWF